MLSTISGDWNDFGEYSVTQRSFYQLQFTDKNRGTYVKFTQIILMRHDVVTGEFKFNNLSELNFYLFEDEQYDNFDESDILDLSKWNTSFLSGGREPRVSSNHTHNSWPNSLELWGESQTGERGESTVYLLDETVIGLRAQIYLSL